MYIIIKGLFDEDNIPWLLEMIKKEMFAGADKITKEKFLEARGDSKERNAFWKTVSQVAIEQFNMKEVFNMKSSVRLTAIERLCEFINNSFSKLFVFTSCCLLFTLL